MPYLLSEARLKSDTYKNLIDADITEQREKVLDLIDKQQLSGSIDANNPTRDDDGFLVSIEDPINQGQAAEGITESVRIENKQQFFNDRYLRNINQEFSFFTPPNNVDTPNDDDIIDAVEEIKTKADTGQITDPFRPIVIDFIDGILQAKSDKASQIKSITNLFFKGRGRGQTEDVESIDENISNDKLNSLIVKVISVFPPQRKKRKLKDFSKLQIWQIDLKIALDLRDYAVVIRDYIFKNKVLRRYYKEFGLPETFTTQTGTEFNLITPPIITEESGQVLSQDDEDELRGKGYIM